MNGYKLIGTDGREYGPVTVEQIQQWIRENRVESRTSMLAPDALVWTTAGSLPEFASHFASHFASASSGVPPIQPSPGIMTPAYTVRSNSMAKAGLICGILAVTVGCCCAGFPFNFLGFIFSLIALVQSAANPRQYGGRGMAIVGMVLSVLSFGFLALVALWR